MSEEIIYITETYTYNSEYTDDEKKFMKNPTYDENFKFMKPKEYDINSDYDSDRCNGFKNKYSNVNKYRKNISTSRRLICAIFGRTLDNKSVMISCIRFRPDFCVIIPKSYQNKEDKFKKLLIKYTKQALYWSDKTKHGNEDRLIDRIEIIERIKQHKFTGFKKRKFLRIYFRNSNTRRKWKKAMELIRLNEDGNFSIVKRANVKIIEDKRHILKIYKYKENETITLFFDKIKSTGFHKIKKFMNVKIKRSVCDYEVVVNYPDIEFIKKHNYKIPNFTILSFDIETIPLFTKKMESEKIIKEFGEVIGKEKIKKAEIHPILDNGDPIAQIGISIKSGDKVKNVVLTLGYDLERKKYKDFELIPFDDEKSLILEFVFICKKVRPDIIYQFNGNAYDWNYIYKRSKNLNILEKFRYISKLNIKSRWIENITGSKQVGKSGNKYPEMPGTTNIDLLIFYVKQNNTKFKDRKLQTISNVLLGKSKLDLPYKKMYDLMEISLDKNINFVERQKSAYTVAKYCLMDCILLHNLADVSNIAMIQFEGGRSNNMSPSSYFYRGSCFKVLSILSKLCEKEGYLIPEKVKDPMKNVEKNYENKIKDDEQFINLFKEKTKSSKEDLRKRKEIKFKDDYIKGYKPAGAYVVKPKSGLYEFVCCMDFASMYPNYIISQNLCQSFFVKNNEILMPEFKYKKIKWMRRNGIIEEQIYHDSKIPGLLSKTLKRQLDSRSETKKIKNEFLKNCELSLNEAKKRMEYKSLYAREMSEKINCNATYGISGSSYSNVYCMPITGCTTFGSKQCLKISSEKIKEWYNAKIVYGDTDSLFIKYPHIENENLTNEEKFKKLYNFSINTAIPRLNKYLESIGFKYMKMDHEKIFIKIIFSNNKKNYEGIQCCGDNFYDREEKIMGKKYKKRDSSKIEKMVGEKIVSLALSMKDNFDHKKAIKEYLIKIIKDIYDNKYDFTYFMKSKVYKPPYKMASQQPHCRSVELIKKYNFGLTPLPNDRVFYTYKREPYILGSRGGIIKPKRCDQVWPLILLETKTGPTNIIIDYKIFIENIMDNSMSIFSYVFDSEEAVIKFFTNEVSKYDKIFS
jgi:DNA polymerase elongation subunit (family B)